MRSEKFLGFSSRWRHGGDSARKRTVDALEPREKAYIAFDREISGFGVRVMPSGVKTFVLEYRPGAGGRGVGKRRLTIGRFGAMTCDQARMAALRAFAEIRLGARPSSGEKSPAGRSERRPIDRCVP